MTVIESLIQLFGEGRVATDKDITPYFTMRTKTTARYYVEAESREDWRKAVSACRTLDLPLTVIGGGSNYAVMTDVIEGLVVRNLYREKEILADAGDTVDLRVTSGYIVARLVKETTDAGYEGFEYHLGLPGTVGGAIFMNSKWTRSQPPSYFGDALVSAVLLTADGTERTVDRDYFQFAYDYSILQKTHELVLEATFRLHKADPVVLKQRAQETVEYRRQTQPHGVATSGCFFRNISDADREKAGVPTKSAGYLIDKAGLKGTRMGAYEVSSVHANFIVNTGGGQSHDLRKLLDHIKTTVHQKFGVTLEEEVLVR